MYKAGLVSLQIELPEIKELVQKVKKPVGIGPYSQQISVFRRRSTCP